MTSHDDDDPPHLIHNAWMQTYTGRAFWPTSPKAEHVDPLDIAHGLSMVCRFGGHTHGFYSVAEHACWMHDLVTPEAAPWALLHDAAEAYVGDMITPLKQQMPNYREIENQIMFAIGARFGVHPSVEVYQEVKAADLRIVADERRAFMKFPPPFSWKTQEDVEPYGIDVTAMGWSPAIAEREWLSRFNSLGLS